VIKRSARTAAAGLGYKAIYYNGVSLTDLKAGVRDEETASGKQLSAQSCASFVSLA
jgi:hypothetical protein